MYSLSIVYANTPSNNVRGFLSHPIERATERDINPCQSQLARPLFETLTIAASIFSMANYNSISYQHLCTYHQLIFLSAAV